MEFEIGDKVYCSYNEATGTITDIKPDETYPIYVTFKNNTTDTYTKRGKLLKSGNGYLEIVERVTSKKEPDSFTLEYVEGLGKVFTLSCGTRILKTLENTHIILPQTSNL